MNQNPTALLLLYFAFIFQENRMFEGTFNCATNSAEPSQPKCSNRLGTNSSLFSQKQPNPTSRPLYANLNSLNWSLRALQRPPRRSSVLAPMQNKSRMIGYPDNTCFFLRPSYSVVTAVYSDPGRSLLSVDEWGARFVEITVGVPHCHLGRTHRPPDATDTILARLTMLWYVRLDHDGWRRP